jgi:hypothetical protein
MQNYLFSSIQSPNIWNLNIQRPQTAPYQLSHRLDVCITPQRYPLLFGHVRALIQGSMANIAQSGGEYVTCFDAPSFAVYRLV